MKTNYKYHVNQIVMHREHRPKFDGDNAVIGRITMLKTLKDIIGAEYQEGQSKKEREKEWAQPW